MGMVNMKHGAIIFASASAFLLCGCALDSDGKKTPPAPPPIMESPANPASNAAGQDVVKDAEDDQNTESAKEPPAGRAEQGINDAIDAEDKADDQDGKDDKPPELDAAQADTIFFPMAVLVLVLAILSAWLIHDRQKRKNMTREANDGSAVPTMTLNNTLDPTPVPSARSSERAPCFAVGNLHHIGKRDEQQDSFCLSNIGDENALRKKGAMAVVADGMGGMEGGSAISQAVTDVFREKYSRIESIENPRTFLLEAAQEAERAVEAYMSRAGVEGGSTLTAILEKNSVLHFISVGDSHIYLWRHGQITRINREHNYGELLKEKAARGEVAQDEPYVNPRRHALTAYIGKGNLNIVDQGECPLAIGDKIFLCSDGVYNALGDDALAAALSGDAATAAQKIERQVLVQNLPKQDNFTGIILEYLA